jgi:hypothetical protein
MTMSCTTLLPYVLGGVEYCLDTFSPKYYRNQTDSKTKLPF